MAQNGRLDGHPARVAVQTSILYHTFLCVAQGNQSMRNSSIGLRPTRPFSAYQTICASDLSPWQRNPEVVYVVREWLLWEVHDVERERERERDACDVIDTTLKSRVIMHMITSTARTAAYCGLHRTFNADRFPPPENCEVYVQVIVFAFSFSPAAESPCSKFDANDSRPNASTRSEPVGCSSACTDKELGAWALEQQGRVINWWMTIGKWKLCLRWLAAVDHPAAFRWHDSSKRTDQVDAYFLFEWVTVLALRAAWIADILSQASLRDVQRQRCWKRGSGDGQSLSLWDYGTTERSFNVVDRRGSTLTWTVCKAIGGSR